MRYPVATTIAAAALAVGPANAAITYTIVQSGANVQVTMGGTFNTTGLTPSFNAFLTSAALSGQIGFVSVGTLNASGAVYDGASGPASFGPGGIAFADIFGGDYVRVNGSTSSIILPTTYSSGAALSGFATYNNRTLTSLGLSTGQYVYTLGQDQITVNIGATGIVPEPATWGMMILGFGMAGAAARRRRGSAIGTA